MCVVNMEIIIKIFRRRFIFLVEVKWIFLEIKGLDKLK